MVLIVQRKTDPFKKYWWAILLVFGLIGLWVSYPALNANSASSLIGAEKGLRPATQSLDPTANPNGAPGGPVDLSMNSSSAYGKNSIVDPFASLLFAPPASLKNAAAGEASGKGVLKKSSSWADALASVASSGNAASAAPVAPAVFPHGNFSSLSGLGGSEASGAFSGLGSSSGGFSGFGAHKPAIGISYAHGLANSGSTNSSGGGAMATLQNAAKNMKAAALASNTSASGAMTSQIFDGSARSGALIGNPKGMAAGVGIQNSNGTPLNLKANDPKLNTFHANPVPVTPPPPPQPSMAQQIMQMIMMALVGGAVSGIGQAIAVAL